MTIRTVFFSWPGTKPDKIGCYFNGGTLNIFLVFKTLKTEGPMS